MSVTTKSIWLNVALCNPYKLVIYSFLVQYDQQNLQSTVLDLRVKQFIQQLTFALIAPIMMHLPLKII